MGKVVIATLLGGLVAGALDIIYAIVVFGPLSYGVPAERVLQSVAAGWIGRDAATAGGWNTALLGLGLHFLIAIGMAAVFVLAASRIGALLRRAVLWGFAYGLLLYVAMNYFIVPLSAAGENGHFAASIGEATARLSEAFSAPRPNIDPARPWIFAGAILVHSLLVGMPIALIAKRFGYQHA